MRNTTNIGNIGYAKVIAKLCELNIPVYSPFGEGYTADLIADFGGKLTRIQIKTTEKVHGDFITWKITKQSGFHGSRVPYTKEEVDYFALYCIQEDILCLVPFEKTTKTVLTIRLDNYKGVRTKTMKFVSDFSFEKVIKEE